MTRKGTGWKVHYRVVYTGRKNTLWYRTAEEAQLNATDMRRHPKSFVDIKVQREGGR